MSNTRQLSKHKVKFPEFQQLMEWWDTWIHKSGSNLYFDIYAFGIVKFLLKPASK